jgi:hypothetical protein
MHFPEHSGMKVTLGTAWLSFGMTRKVYLSVLEAPRDGLEQHIYTSDILNESRTNEEKSWETSLL